MAAGAGIDLNGGASGGGNTFGIVRGFLVSPQSQLSEFRSSNLR